MLWLSMESSSGARVDRIAKRQTYKELPLNDPQTAVFDPNQNINASITSAAVSIFKAHVCLFPWNNKQLSTVIPSLAASCIIIPHHPLCVTQLHASFILPQSKKAYYSNFFGNGKRISDALVSARHPLPPAYCLLFA